MLTARRWRVPNHPMSSRPSQPGWSASELVTAAVIIVGAGLLRLWSPAALGIEHYDEGVYVISALGLTDPSLPDPLFAHQMFFSPPLYFGLVALAGALSGGPLDIVAVLVSGVFGTLTVALVWWTGRTWFSPGAGLAAAALLALSEFHIALSRSALTDVLFAFFHLLTVVLIERALRRSSFALAGAAGLSAGLAWNTKYHGWLALALGLAAWALFVWRSASIEGWKRHLGLWTLILSVALAAYAPWALYVQAQPGGYAGLTIWQGVFMEGGWLRNVSRHVSEQRFLDGPLTDSSILIAAGIGLLGLAARRLSAVTILMIAALGLACCVAEGWAVVLLLAAGGLLLLARGPDTAAGWLATVWICAFAILTPFYHPYARLFLPITIMSCLLAGLCLTGVAARLQAGERGMARLAVASVALLGAMAVFAARSGDTPDPWRSARGAAEDAAAMAKVIPLGSHVKVIEEPAVAYYLSRLGFDTLRNVHDKEIPTTESTPLYVVTGYYGTAGLLELGDRVTQIAHFPMNPKDLRLADDLAPPFVSRPAGAQEGEHDLLLFRVAPLGGR